MPIGLLGPVPKFVATQVTSKYLVQSLTIFKNQLKLRTLVERLATWRKAWPPVVSAILMIAAFPPFNLGLVVFAALAPWFAELGKLERWQPFRSGYLFGLVFMGAQFVWQAQFVGRWAESFWLGALPATICTLISAIYFALAAWFVSICMRRSWLFAIPLVWAGIEAFRSFIPGLAFPWGLVHTPLHPYPVLIQTANYGTAYLVSAWIVLANVCIAMIVSGLARHQIRPFAFVFLVLGIASWMKASTPMAGKALQVAVGQPGFDMAFNAPEVVARELPGRIAEIERRLLARPVELLVLPEGLIRVDGTLPTEVPLPLSSGYPTVLGGSRVVDGRLYQSAFGYDGGWQVADKRWLVIFGEYVPFRDRLPFLDSFRLPSGDLHPASQTTALKFKDFKVGPILCFEALFSDVAADQAKNGANILAVMSLDDWFMGTAAPEQLAAASVFRAVETGLPLVRAAPLGISMAVDQRGNVLRRLPIGKLATFSVEVVAPERAEWNPWSVAFPWICTLSLFAVPLANRLWSQKTSGEGT